MEEDNRFIVKQKKQGNVGYIFLATLMTLLCLLLVFVDYSGGGSGIMGFVVSHAITLYILKGIMAFGALFFGYATYFLFRRALGGKDILIVDENGVTDNSSAVALGFIPWQDIKDIHLRSTLGNYFIELELFDEEKYLKRLKGIKKLAVKINLNTGHELVCITLNSTGVGYRTVMPVILTMFEQKTGRIPQDQLNF